MAGSMDMTHDFYIGPSKDEHPFGWDMGSFPAQADDETPSSWDEDDE